MFNPDFNNDDEIKLWQALKGSANHMQKEKLIDLFAKDPTRVSKFSLTVDQLYWDFSKNFLTEEILEQLVALANFYDVKGAILRLMTGEMVNTTENRPAWHTALRYQKEEAFLPLDSKLLAIIAEQKAKMAKMVETIQNHQWLGATQQPITDIVNLGIGGSDLGPKMVVQALEYYRQATVNLHFVSNVDPMAISSLLQTLNPATTLFIISSKSFTTPETLANVQVAKQWLSEQLSTNDLTNHFIAVTAQPKKAQAFGIPSSHCLTFEAWVGGRYSVWSTIGLPLALFIGMKNFEAFLQGASKMDAHFASAPMAENMPVLLALLGIWYIHGWDAETLAVLPYAEGLRSLPDYLQQLDMESNGKGVNHDGHIVTGATGPIVWGQAGTNGQHAFYQLLHQGTHFVPIDFIVAAQSDAPLTQQHQFLVANCLAQAQALMQGTPKDQNYPPHEVMPGNKPSNIFLLPKITPYTLGQLLALYEHKVFVQGVIWQVNSFDQPGVELGKKLAQRVFESLKNGSLDANFDPSTRAMIQKIGEL
ncbi:MAG: glucose-6-phosphate isomerase [Candidatus Berkiellales bacterium]